VTGRGTTTGPDGPESCGAKVEAVPLGLSALGVETAEGAALGLNAFGFVLDGAALGLMELGPVAAGADPGAGVNTPCALIPLAAREAASASGINTTPLMIAAMAASQTLPPPENVRGALGVAEAVP
jgi:hypothetical protein